ncbi:ABC transporter [candidate division WOR-1 bacterium DG_54_3]|uniref:ABC transporter n=1 Tax=candidate division WOR-1 bacterium DG_54_3 TaxID=1703775 RepID=A0A0S7XJI6_UNCSA|nr:MAG: ABC transporter [candidate division WOR-1 bacterium DG_54_3]
MKKAKSKKKNKNNQSTVVALENANIKIHQGELFGLLGPNGAGKTTLIKILATLLLPNSGTALVDGIDVVKYPEKVRRKINMVSGGEQCGYGILTVKETLWMFSQFYGLPSRVVHRRIDELLKILKMEEFARTKIGKLSTGLRQKLNFMRGFVCDPKIMFLDEPTLGLDVQIARDVRAYIRTWMKENSERTILLTTHYMAEADELCDRVAIIDRGKVLVCDTPQSLKKSLAGEAVFRIEIPLSVNGMEKFGQVPGVKQFAYEHKSHLGRTELKFILEEEAAISNVTESLSGNGSKIITLSKMEPSLEDVFVALVGRGLKDEN